jgi:anti-sigma regulatory factor (Ser/Thr protein kinase)
VFEELEQALSDFRNGTEQSDDITLAEILFDVDAISQTNSKPQYRGKDNHPSATWGICFEFQADVLRHTDPLPVIINSITEMQGRNSNLQQLYTVLAEIYSNSLEHGLLGLDSSLKVTSEGFEQYYQMRQERLSKLSEGSIKISATHMPEKSGGKLVLRVEDSGKGFDFTSNNGLPMAGNRGHSGRGVPLLRSLCESVDYQGCGNIVEVVYVW